MKIYTKTGDKGSTSDVLGYRVSKADLKIELQGSIDEINAEIGFARSLLKNNDFTNSAFDIDDTLKEVQHTLFRIGGDVSSNFTYNYVKESDIAYLEQQIDIITEAVGELENFIYYSGNSAAAYCQVIRSVTRRAERIFVRHLEGKEYNLDYQYINRLSDFMFALARYINFLTDSGEEIMTLR